MEEKKLFVHSAPRGVNRRHSTVLSRQEEALIAAFRKHPMDDCLYSLQKTIPNKLQTVKLLKTGAVNGKIFL